MDSLLKTVGEHKLPRISVVICTLNEEKSLPYVLRRIPPWVSEVLIVDGHSTDDTVKVARELRPDVRVVYQPGRGKGDALRYGIRQARGDIVVTLDADGQTDPEEMGKFIRPLLQGYDFAKGTRFRRILNRSRPLHRIIGNWIISLTFNLLFRRFYTDICSGYNAFWKSAIQTIDLDYPDGLADEPLLYARVVKAGLKLSEVPHQDRVRIAGNSKAPSLRQGFNAIKTILRERFH